jgi:hypothetical protein
MLKINEGSLGSTNHPFNATIIDFQINGLTNSTFQASSINIMPEDSGVYTTIQFSDSFRFTTDLMDGSVINLTLQIGGSIVKLSVSGGSLAINGENAQISAKYAAIQSTGTTNMEKAYLSTNPSAVLVLGYPALISGKTSFTIENIDQHTIRISNFLLDGKLSVQKPVNMWNEWDIPWVRILTSSYFWIFVIFTLLFLFALKKFYLSKYLTMNFN